MRIIAFILLHFVFHLFSFSQIKKFDREDLLRLLRTEDGLSIASSDYCKNTLNSSIVVVEIFNCSNDLCLKIASFSTHDFDLLCSKSKLRFFKVTKIDDPRIIFISSGLEFCSFKKECIRVNISKAYQKDFVAIFEPTGNIYKLINDSLYFQGNTFW